MRTKYFWKFLLMMLSVSLTSSAADKNVNRQVMERLIKLADQPVKYLPKMVATDDDAYEYCESILSRTDKEYARDTADINARLRQAEWVLSNKRLLSPKEAKKYKNYNEVKLELLYDFARIDMEEIPVRYMLATQYCNRMLLMRAEAMKRVMPDGELEGLRYSESGSSRPWRVDFELYRDWTTKKYMLRGYIHDRNGRDQLVVCQVDKTVRQHIRSLIEKYQLQKLITYYGLPPAFPKHAQPLGGPPSWSLRLDLEGGMLSSGSDGMGLFSGSEELVGYLRQILTEAATQ